MPLNLATRLTLCRIIAVPFFISLILYYKPGKDYLLQAALAVFLLAVTLDVIDGYIARAYAQVTKIGSILDPLADKILMIGAFVCLHMIRESLPVIHFPVWFIVFVICRDVFLMLGALVVQMVKGDLHPKPSVWGKASTFFQALSVIVVLLQWPQAGWVWSTAAVVSAVAGVQYIVDGLKLLSEGEAS